MPVTINARAMFSEIYARGRGDITQFSQDFLELPPPIKKLHKGQVKWLHSAPWCPERMLSSGNRWGKTVTAAVKLLHNSFYQMRLPQYHELTHEYLAISLSITLDMARIAWDWLLMVMQNSPLMKRFLVHVSHRPFPALTLGDHRGAWRSEIWARSTAKRGVYLLGRTFDLVNWDEAARDPLGPFILDDVLRMRMADRQGRIDMTSTGAGKNWYWKQCDLGRKDEPHYLKYYFQTGSTYENPSISKARLKDAKSRMSDRMVQQNIYGEFVDFATVFPVEDIEKCYRGQDYHLIASPNEAEKLISSFPPDATFVMGVDFGRKRDETVILVSRTDVQPCRIIYAQGMLGDHWEKIYETVAKVHHTFKDCLTVVDSTAMAGDISVDLLRGERYNVRNLIPFNFAGGKAAKEHLITVGQMAIQQRAVVWPYIGQLYDQLGMYDYNDKNLVTDWVMAFCMMAEGIRRSTESRIQIAPAAFLVHTLRRGFGFDNRYQHHAYAGEAITLTGDEMPTVLNSSRGRVH